VTQNRGSTWNCWDLHIHTPASFHHEFGTESWDRYLDELEEIDDVPCIGITDYFSLDGYRRVQEAREEGRLENFDLILPNIELRVDDVVVERSDDDGEDSAGAASVDLHVIFSDDLTPREIEQNFLHQISADVPNRGEIPLTQDNIEHIGELDEFDHLDDDSSGDPFKKGCERINVRRESVYEALENDIFRGKYLVVVDTETLDDMPWRARPGSLRATIVSKVDALFTANENARKFYLGQLPDNSPEEIIETFGGLMPCIRGSDAHDFESLCSPPENNYCWIKADTTFEGLKQIQYEPEDRVRIQEENPLGHVSNRTPTSVEFRNGRINDRLEISDTQIPLNPNLVTVIGGKGAGKTAFLDLIANCYQDRCIRDKDEEVDMNSFVQRIEDLEPGIETEIQFFDEDIDTFSKQVIDEDLIQHSDLEYLPQGQIAEHCRDEDRLHEQVIKLIKESVRKSDPELMERFENSNEKISSLENELDSLTNRIHELNPEAIDEEMAEARRAVEQAKGDLQDIQDEIERFRERHEDEFSEDPVTELQSEIDTLDEQIEDLTTLDVLVDDQLERLEVVEDYNNQITRLEELTSEYGLEYSTNRINLSERRESLLELQERINARKSQLEQRKRDIRGDLEEFRDIDEEISDLMNERRELNKEVQSRESRVTELENKQERLEDLREARKETFYEYIEEMDNYESVYSIVINEFSEERSDILDEITFEASTELKDGMISDLFSHLDGRAVNYAELQSVKNALQEAMNSPGRREELLDEYLREVHKFDNDLKSSTDLVEYEREIYSGHFKLNENIYFEGSQMDALSLGQKGTVLLKILLAQDKSPLIIDQPEENLDNKFIYRSLKDAFKTAKTNRRVIIATHNANLVVNTDAEQVIVAEYENNTIEFTAGALENHHIRDSVTTILEGGEKAFKEREEKYGF